MFYRRHLNRMIAAVAVMVFLLLSCAYASEDFPAPGSKGSISVVIKDRETQEPVPGGKLIVYQAAKVVTGNGYRYAYTDDFASFQKPIQKQTDLDEALAASLAAFADQNSLKGTPAAIGQDGKAQLKDLELGLYLVVQSEAGLNHTRIDPFLVSVPLKTEDGWVLDVDATPKPGSADECEPVKLSLSVSKKITGENVPSAVFRFLFKRVGNSPMPVNAKGLASAGGPVVSSSEEELLLQIRGTGQETIGEITFNEPGNYYYLCNEKNTGEKNFTYDTAAWWCRIRIEKKENGQLAVGQILLKKGGSEGTVIYDGTDDTKAVFAFTNAYKAASGSSVPGSGQKLPQTGQLWWPVLALAAAGLLLIIFGAVLRGKRR